MLTCVVRISVCEGVFMSENDTSRASTTRWHRLMEFVERILEEAAQRGEFDGSRGGPLRLDGGPGWWVRRHVEALRLSEAADARLAVVERDVSQLWLLPSEAAVRTRVAELNDTLNEARLLHVSLDADETVKTWRRMTRLRFRRP